MASIPTQEEILAATRKSQEAMIAAIRNWLETARTATPKLVSAYAPLTDKLPRLPSVSLPFADKLPTPEEAVASAYDTAERLLASQRRFTEELLKAMTPLIPGLGQDRAAWQEAVATGEPKPVAASAAPAPASPTATQAAPASPAAHPAAQAAPRTTGAKRTAASAASKRASAPSARKSNAGSALRP
jgi:hypothetical protein